ncbi:MAG: hypothetical protein FWF81_01445 [Defluviitaleaceae bacterium]|nr:hypothetical protein [Defluviitaleaceae bacterium]
MSELKNLINNSLNGEMLANALDFAVFLDENDMSVKESEVSFQNEVVCYMHIDSGEEEPSPWTIWTEGNYSNEIEGVPIDEHTKEIAWEHINICASCGDCNPGQRKVIFGKEFDNVCNADMAFYRPNVEMLECIKGVSASRC